MTQIGNLYARQPLAPSSITCPKCPSPRNGTGQKREMRKHRRNVRTCVMARCRVRRPKRRNKRRRREKTAGARASVLRYRPARLLISQSTAAGLHGHASSTQGSHHSVCTATTNPITDDIPTTLILNT